MKKILILNDIHHGETRESSTHPGEIRQANSQALATLSGYLNSFNSKDYDCVINLGDAIRDTNNKAADLVMLEEFMMVFEKINGNKFFVPGNHELKTLTNDEICSLAIKYNVSSLTPQIFELENTQIILINGDIDENSLSKIPEENIAWIEKNVSYDKQLILLSHYSLVELDGYANFYFANDYKHMSYTNGNKLLNVLKRLPKVASINAHTHMGSYKRVSNVCAISALAFSENIVAMQHPDANPGIFSEIWIDEEKIFFKSFSGKYCFLSIEL